MSFTNDAQQLAATYQTKVMNESAAYQEKNLVLFESRHGDPKVRERTRLDMRGLMEAEGIPAIDDPWVRAGTAAMLKNLAEHHRGLDETTKALHVGNFERFSYPIVRAVYPNLIAHQLVSTQPMLGPISLVFYMKFLYASTKGGVVAGQDMIENPDHNYGGEQVEDESAGTGNGAATQFQGNLSWTPLRPGSLVLSDGDQVVTDDGNGNLVGDVGAGNNTVNYGTGAYDVTFAAAPDNGDPITAAYQFNMEANNSLPEVDLVLTSTPVMAKPRKLRTKWSVEAGQDLMAVHNMSAEVELVSAIANELRFEVDQDIIRDLLKISHKDVNGGWSKTPGAGVSYTEHKTTFWDTVTAMSNNIFQKTGRAEMTWIVAGTNVASVIETMPGFVKGTKLAGRGVYQTGTLNGYPVFKNSYMPDAVIDGQVRPGADRFMVGFRGDQMFETGYVYSPYQMFYATPTVRLDDFQSRKAVATRYGKKVIDSRFYQDSYIRA